MKTTISKVPEAIQSENIRLDTHTVCFLFEIYALYLIYCCVLCKSINSERVLLSRIDIPDFRLQLLYEQSII